MNPSDQSNAVAEAVTESYDILIIGGGILGTATALILATAGYRPIVFRLDDASCPRADTLRNQGWLQSGILYARSDFSTTEEYVSTVRRTYSNGHVMMRTFGLPISDREGVVRVLKESGRRGKLEERRRLFRYKRFHELTSAEAERRIGDLYETDSVYYNLPDIPFDEGELVETLRQRATTLGARFIDLASPVTFSAGVRGMRVHVENITVDPPVMLVAAGAGIAQFLSDVGEQPRITLRQTPLMVYTGQPASSMPPIFVDYERGFSSVRHDTKDVASGSALVIGTKTTLDDVPYVLPHDRRIPNDQVEEFKRHLSPRFRAFLPESRFTAGVEVIPKHGSFLDAWIEELGSVLLASPGRATQGWATALVVSNRLIDKLNGGHGFQHVNVGGLPEWKNPVRMHFTDQYSHLNDIEEP